MINFKFLDLVNQIKFDSLSYKTNNNRFVIAKAFEVSLIKIYPSPKSNALVDNNKIISIWIKPDSISIYYEDKKISLEKNIEYEDEEFILTFDRNLFIQLSNLKKFLINYQ